MRKGGEEVFRQKCVCVASAYRPRCGAMRRVCFYFFPFVACFSPPSPSFLSPHLEERSACICGGRGDLAPLVVAQRQHHGGGAIVVPGPGHRHRGPDLQRGRAGLGRVGECRHRRRPLRPRQQQQQRQQHGRGSRNGRTDRPEEEEREEEDEEEREEREERRKERRKRGKGGRRPKRKETKKSKSKRRPPEAGSRRGLAQRTEDGEMEKYDRGTTSFWEPNE